MKKLLLMGGLAALTCLASGLRAQEDGVAPESTIIRSKGPLRMENDGVEAYFEMSDEVVLTGTNLEVNCDHLQVWAERLIDPDKPKSIGKIQAIRRVLATGHVVIIQAGRRATAEQVEVLAKDEIIILTGDPVVTDPSGTMKGTRMTIRKGQETIEIEHPEAVLEALPNFGFPGDSTKRPAEAPAAEDAANPAPAEGSVPAP